MAAEGLLLLGGEGPERRQLEPVLRRAPLVIAADSGFDLAVRLGIQPDLLAEIRSLLGDPGVADRAARAVLDTAGMPA